MRLPRLPTPSPLLRLTFAITSICGLLVLLADGLLGAFPTEEQRQLEQRRLLAETLAVQTASMLRAQAPEALQHTLKAALQRSPDSTHLLLRRADGTVALVAGQPPATALHQRDARSTPERLVVPLSSGGEPWGQLELGYAAPSQPIWRRWLGEPLVATLLMFSLGGSTLIGLYLRRALQHLDPMAVIPERVQGAFDVMTEGVVVLDGRARVLLANRAFAALHPSAAALKPGQQLSQLPWLARGLALDDALHPWQATLRDGEPINGSALKVEDARGREQQLLLNTMPITDGRGRVQGCVVSFSDFSPLHRANAQLERALHELKSSKAEVERKNEELQRMATRDPMTGCLNRRAFNEAFQPLFEAAQRNGTPLSCLILDIDHFKKVNDTHGHGIGDRVIQETARKLQDCARGSDLVCRYGGEEFVVVLPGLDARGALEVGERVRARIEAECGPAVREVPGMHVTASVGVAVLEPAVQQTSQLVDNADQALYQSKRNGRNRVTLAPPMDEPAEAPAEAAALPG